MNIKIEINGKTIEGYWNQKFYSSKQENCKRIYVNNVEYNLSDEIIEKFLGKEFEQQNERKKIEELEQKFEEITNEDKIIFFLNCYRELVINQTIERYFSNKTKELKNQTLSEKEKRFIKEMLIRMKDCGKSLVATTEKAINEVRDIL